MSISPALVWFLFGIACFYTELALPGFVLFFLGIGAWCTTALLAVFDFSTTGQLLVFLASSLVSLIALRSWLSSIFQGSSSKEADSANMDSAPSNGVVTDAIVPPAHGRVKHGGSSWLAVADEPLAAGTVVRIVERNNLVVKVRAAEERQGGST